MLKISGGIPNSSLIILSKLELSSMVLGGQALNIIYEPIILNNIYMDLFAGVSLGSLSTPKIFSTSIPMNVSNLLSSIPYNLENDTINLSIKDMFSGSAGFANIFCISTIIFWSVSISLG